MGKEVLLDNIYRDRLLTNKKIKNISCSDYLQVVEDYEGYFTNLRGFLF
jgi:hypothetical protein